MAIQFLEFLLGDVEVEVEARGGVGEVGGGLGFDRGVEVELVAAAEGDRVIALVGPGEGGEGAFGRFEGFTPGVGADRERLRATAAGGEGEEGPFVFAGVGDRGFAFFTGAADPSGAVAIEVVGGIGGSPQIETTSPCTLELTMLGESIERL